VSIPKNGTFLFACSSKYRSQVNFFINLQEKHKNTLDKFYVCGIISMYNFKMAQSIHSKMEEIMKKTKRLLVLMIAVILVLCTVTSINAAKVTFTDVSSHWAWTNGYIPYLVDKGILSGYQESNGTYTFRPDNPVTRAEFVKMLDETFGLTKTTTINYSDVKTSDWYYVYFAKAAAQGYLFDYGTKLDPNGKIPREEAISLLVRYLDLPSNERVSVTAFTDYSKISDKYKDYILRAAYASITDGVANGDGTYSFKPQDPLSRAEALTILYRAAGCIFNTSATSREASAYKINNVITKSDGYVKGVTLSGRTIISEGASSGTVSFTRCKINGTLYVRSAASVSLDNCTVENLIVSSGTKVSLVGGTIVKNMIVENKSTINIYSSCSVENMTVKYDAANTKVQGDGILKNVEINAKGFISAMVPEKFEIGNNLIATFGSTQFSGSSSAQNAFVVNPFSSTDGTYHYANVYSEIGGMLYYYYTNSSGIPTVSAYGSYYDAASYAGRTEIAANAPISIPTFESSKVQNYSYVVVQLQKDGRKYAPVLFDNASPAGSIFSTEPTLENNTMKFKTSSAGTLYWYFAESGTNLTPISFISNYRSISSELKNEMSVTVLRTSSIELKDNILDKYEYIAFMLKNTAGQYYNPVVVPIGSSQFVSNPIVTTPGTIRFTSSISGELYYYYAKTNDLPTTEAFKAEYNAAGARYNDYISIRANLPTTLSYNTDFTATYPYLIMAIRNADGVYMPPVALFIDYSTGFVVEPEPYTESRIRFKTENYGSIKYYYTKSNTAPTIEGFNSSYNSTSSRYKGEVKDLSKYYEYLEYTPAYAMTYPYMAIMFIDDAKTEYTPVLVSLDVSENTGFSTMPKVSDGKIIFKTYSDGDVMYFYTINKNILTPDDFEVGFDNAGYNLRGNVEVAGGTTGSFEVDYDKLKKAPYLCVAFYNATTKKTGFPVVLDVDSSESESSGSTGIALTIYSDYISMKAKSNGTILLYTTNEKTLPTTENFIANYNAASTRRKVDMEYNQTLTFNFNSDKYVAICMISNDNLLTPILINSTKGNIIDDEDDFLDTSTKAGSGMSSITIDRVNKLIKVKPAHSGTVSFMIMSAGKLQEVASETTTAESTVSFDYSRYEAIMSVTGFVPTFYVQLTTATDVYEATPVTIY